MGTHQVTTSPEETKCYVGPFGRFLPIESHRPTWLRSSSPSTSPRRRTRDSPRPGSQKRPTGLQFGSDTALSKTSPGESSRRATPSPACAVGTTTSPRFHEQSADSQVPAPICYASSLSDWSSESSRTPSPDEARPAHEQRLSSDDVYPPLFLPYLPHKRLQLAIPFSEPTIASDEASDLPTGISMGGAGSEGALFPQRNSDFESFDCAKAGSFSSEYMQATPSHYHRSRLPYIPGLGNSQVTVSNPSDLPGEDILLQSAPPSVPQPSHRVYVVEERVIRGEGMCYVYSDGSHCPKYRNGELVNANWGITKAGKPRKRLAQACLTCRSKKIKCVPNFPKCDQCRKNGRSCRYENAVRRNSSRGSSRPSSSQLQGSGRPLSPFETRDLPSKRYGGGLNTDSTFAGMCPDVGISPTS